MNYQEQKDKTAVSQPKDPAGDPQDPLVGQILAGKYKITRLLGKGGMSSVYQARHQLLNKTFAIKILHDKNIHDQQALVRFKQEATAASKLSHPNIITVWDFDAENDRPFQAIDYLEGASLFDEIKKHKGLAVERALPIWLQICQALGHAHKHHVIHRDLKPSNVMLITHEGTPDFVKIVDFGIAKILPQEGEAIHQLTQTGEVFGSPYYMSPEQCMGKRLDLRSDIYSMGCLMYETVAGSPPFVGNAVFETIQMHIDAMPRSLKDLVADQRLAQQLDFIICKTMAKDPAQRYQSMEELAADLRNLQSGHHTGVFSRIAQQGSMLQIKGTQLLRNKSLRLAAVLVAFAALLAFWGVSPLMRFLTVRPPAFRMTAWPLFSAEFEPSTSNDSLAKTYQLQQAVDRIAGQITDLSRPGNTKDKVQRWREVAAAEARMGAYDQAAVHSGNLHVLLMGRESRIENNVDAGDRAEALADYAAIGDACYFAAPTRENGQRALFFYQLATDQLADNAEHALHRLYMKMGDLQLRLGQPILAQKALELASGSSDAAFRPHLFDDPNPSGVMDHAIFCGLVGDAVSASRDWSLADSAYQCAAGEYGAAGNQDLAAQSYFLAASCQLSEGPSKEHLAGALASLSKARSLVEKTSPPELSRLAAIDDQRATIYSAQHNYLSWLQAKYNCQLEAMQVTSK